MALAKIRTVRLKLRPIRGRVSTSRSDVRLGAVDGLARIIGPGWVMRFDLDGPIYVWPAGGERHGRGRILMRTDDVLAQADHLDHIDRELRAVL